MQSVLFRLLTDDPTPHAAPDGDLNAYWAAHGEYVGGVERPMDRALLGGLRADRVGYAFVAGYRNALQVLAPMLVGNEIVSLCATEAGGNQPRAIETRFADGRLNGRKRWATLGGRATSLLIVASTGQENGRNRLKVVRVRSDQPGVRVVRMDEAPFLPEIPHAEIHLDDVEIRDGDILPGDGYDAYLKPFRTVEDLHVHAALIGYLIGVARRSSWPRERIEELTSLVASVRSLAEEAPLEGSTHVALAGFLTAAHFALERVEPLWAQVDPGTRARWTRDRMILNVAAKAREARREAAWRRLAVAHAGRS